MQAWKIIIPTSSASPEPRAHDGHERIYVLSGRMRLVLGDQDRYGQARSLVSRSNSNAGSSAIQRPLCMPLNERRNPRSSRQTSVLLPVIRSGRSSYGPGRPRPGL